MKRLSDELNCQRQNSESARRSLEQKLKENEKEYQKVRHCIVANEFQLRGTPFLWKYTEPVAYIPPPPPPNLSIASDSGLQLLMLAGEYD